MYKEQRKTLVLGLLILLCIWQTGKLWLGNMSSLNFFEKPLEYATRQIEPQSIWITPGAPTSLVYRLIEGDRDYQSVRVEIERNISKYMQEAKTGGKEPLSWDSILTKQGILYEYPIPLTYGEVIGNPGVKAPASFPQGEVVDYLFIPLAEERKGIMKWYLITSDEEEIYPLEVQGTFENMKAFNDLLKEEALSRKVKYQPTYKMSGVSTRNLFLPLSSEELPLLYDILAYSNPLEEYTQEEEFSRFNPYINHFFLNPLLKKEEKTEEGVYIFSELMRAVVKYYPSGIFEYSNIGVGAQKERPSRLGAYNTAKNFLDENESIPKEIRKKLFLAETKQTEAGYIFYFNLRFEGLPVYLSEEIKEYFGMEHGVEINVQGAEISNFKWNAWVLTPQIDHNNHRMGQFTMKYTEALNKVLEYVSQQGETKTLAIDDMKWVYMITKDEDVYARWIIRHNDNWYSTQGLR